VSSAARRFEADMTEMLDLLPPSDRDALSGIVSRLLISYAARQGVDLFAGLSTGSPPPPR
jgi:hypothetical protein